MAIDSMWMLDEQRIAATGTSRGRPVNVWAEKRQCMNDDVIELKESEEGKYRYKNQGFVFETYDSFRREIYFVKSDNMGLDVTK